MQIRHELDKDKVYIYINIDETAEFSEDFFKTPKKFNSFICDIKKYVKENIKKGDIKVAIIVLNGTLVGSIGINMLLDAKVQQGMEEIDSKSEITGEVIKPEEKSGTLKNVIAHVEELELEVEGNIARDKKEAEKNLYIEEKKTVKQEEEVVKEEIASAEEDIYVNLQTKDGNKKIYIEDYVAGVVAAEMPSFFTKEALKAQAVAARTYAMQKIENGLPITDTIKDQVYKSEDILKKEYGNNFTKYYNNVKDAVRETKGQTMKYNGKHIEALYFAISNGKTELATNVFSKNRPYLQVVDSREDTALKACSYETSFSYADISNKLNLNFNNQTEIKILSRTEGDRVDKIKIDGKIFSGKEIREKLGLRSTDFVITKLEDKLIIKTKGFGHGVGMSQYGANELAKQGKNYIEILKHYYTGVEI